MQAQRRTYVGIALIALSLLVFEVVLTRIFSAVMWYHFAVLSISLAMFGSAASGVLLYTLPRRFVDGWLRSRFGWLVMLYSASLVGSYLAFLGVTPLPRFTLPGLMNLGLIYVFLAVPFLCGGACLSAAIMLHRESVSRVYSADLVGAALGCMASIALLNLLGAPAAILVASLVALCAACIFLVPPPARRRQLLAAACWFALLALLFTGELRWHILRPDFVKHGLRTPGSDEVEVWNSHSRVTVSAEMPEERPFGWGIPASYRGPNPGWRRISIDGMAETPLTHFDGDFASVSFLDHDVTSLAFQLEEPRSALVVGAGGGRDVLTALRHGHGPIMAVELNRSIVRLVEGRYASYVGDIYARPGVKVVVDEARSYLSKHPEKLGIIIASAVDTWAATLAGATALTENSLYTLEGFATFFERLEADGVLSMTRFYYPGDERGEVLRLVNTALTALEARGATEPSRHMLLVAAGSDEGVVNMLVKLRPWSAAELERAQALADSYGFQVVYRPGGASESVEARLVTSPDRAAFAAAYPVDISPCTDDRPFFFQLVKASRLGEGIGALMGGASVAAGLRLKPLVIVLALFAIALVLSIVFMLGPILLSQQHAHGPGLRAWFWHVAFFAALGVGFMFVEIGVMQRLMIVLGHPVNALAVILFTLLVASGCGSLLTHRVAARQAPRRALVSAAGLALLIPVVTLALPHFQILVIGWAQPLKIAACVVFLALPGLVMGSLFPLGIKGLTEARAGLVPWCWAANGAASVGAAVAALVVALFAGLSAVILLGAVAYAVAAGCAWRWPRSG